MKAEAEVRQQQEFGFPSGEFCDDIMVVAERAKVSMAVGNRSAATLNATKESLTENGLKHCSIGFMPPNKNPMPTMSTLLEMTALIMEVCTTLFDVD